MAMEKRLCIYPVIIGTEVSNRQTDGRNVLFSENTRSDLNVETLALKYVLHCLDKEAKSEVLEEGRCICSKYSGLRIW